MLTLTLFSVSHKQPSWVNDAFQEYTKRLPARELKFEFKEIKPEPREGKTIAHAMALEAARINAALPKSAHIIAILGNPPIRATLYPVFIAPSLRMKKNRWFSFLKSAIKFYSTFSTGKSSNTNTFSFKFERKVTGTECSIKSQI